MDRMSAIGSYSTKFLNYALSIKREGKGEEREVGDVSLKLCYCRICYAIVGFQCQFIII